VKLGKVDAVRGVRVINGSAGQDFITREYYYQIDQEAGLFWSDEGGKHREEHGEREGGIRRSAHSPPSFSLPFRFPADRYHDHSMGTTALNAYAGLAGLFFIRDHREHKLQVRKAQACGEGADRGTAGMHADTPLLALPCLFSASVSLSFLQLSGVLPSGRYEWPLVLKDYWFMPNSGQLWYSLFGEHEVREKTLTGRKGRTAQQEPTLLGQQ